MPVQSRPRRGAFGVSMKRSPLTQIGGAGRVKKCRLVRESRGLDRDKKWKKDLPMTWGRGECARGIVVAR